MDSNQTNKLLLFYRAKYIFRELPHSLLNLIPGTFSIRHFVVIHLFSYHIDLLLLREELNVIVSLLMFELRK